jgi:uncharacterized protein (DUF302 family)
LIAGGHGEPIASGYRIESERAFHVLGSGVQSGREAMLSACAHEQEIPMTRSLASRFEYFCVPLVLVLMMIALASSAWADSDDGIVRVKSAVPMAEAITRIKEDIATKGIKFFSEIDQSKLAADAGIKLRPSTLLVFGNPPLGTQFITSNPNAGLDWPVRLLLTQDDNGDVWAIWTDFEWIARRHNIRDRAAQFKMATSVVGSITSTITTK